MQVNVPSAVSDNCLRIVEDQEGLFLSAYLCPANILTIGYGHKLLPRWDGPLFGLSAEALQSYIDDCEKECRVSPDAQRVLRINRDQAYQLLKRDINSTALFVKCTSRVDLNQNQFDALVSFTYNVGQNAYVESTLKKKLNVGDYAGAAEQFMLWTHGHNSHRQKVVLPGLVKRRARERELFEKPL